MKKLGRCRGCCRGKIIHLGQLDRHSATRSIAGNTASIDAATDDKQVNNIVLVVMIQ
jgi:hypothetical protein